VHARISQQLGHVWLFSGEIPRAHPEALNDAR